MKNYLIYQEAERLLKQSGLSKRIEKLYASENSPYFGHVMNSDVPDYVNELKEDGYFETLPESEKDKFQSFLNGVYSEDKDIIWNVNGEDRVVESSDKLEQLLIFSGFHASYILSPEEIWNFQKFGFNSISEFVGTVGTKVINQSLSSFRDGFFWTSENEGRILESKITGDTHADLRISQKDMTEYNVIDSLGNKVHYRPLLREDRFYISPYHSTETSFLVGLLKYISQEQLESELLLEPNEFIKWIDSLGQGGGTCAEHFGGSISSFGARNHFIGFEDNLIPQLDDNMQTDVYSRYGVMNIGKATFDMYVKSDKSLIFSYEGNKNKNKQINGHFYPNDVDNMLKGIFYQSAKGLGRTSAKELKDVLEYYLENR